MTMFVSQAKYENEVYGFQISPWKQSHFQTSLWNSANTVPKQLGQPLTGATPLRLSNNANFRIDGNLYGKRKQKKQVCEEPEPVHTPVKSNVQPPLPIAATPLNSAATYTNDPYSFEHFTPPPPEVGRYRFGQEDLSPEEIETDQHKIQQRLKQIGFGKSTKGYETYERLVVKHLREIDNEYHPVTPRADQKCSKRSWDGQLKRWRRLLHRWDSVPKSEDGLSPLASDTSGQHAEDEVPVQRRTSAEIDSCSVSLMDLFPDEPSNHSWASECSETPEVDDLSDVADSWDGSDSTGRLRAMRRSL